MKLENRVAVITGAASGIGRACAIGFANEGARVVLADINLAGARETRRAIEAAGGTAHAVETDVANPADVERLVSETLRRFSEVHVLLNDAAIQVNKPWKTPRSTNGHGTTPYLFRLSRRVRRYSPMTHAFASMARCL